MQKSLFDYFTKTTKEKKISESEEVPKKVEQSAYKSDKSKKVEQPTQLSKSSCKLVKNDPYVCTDTIPVVHETKVVDSDIMNKSYKRLRVISDDEDSDICDGTTKKLKYDTETPNNSFSVSNDIDPLTPSKSQQSDVKNPTSAKAFLASFSKKSTNCEIETTNEQTPTAEDDKNFDHFNFQFLKKEFIRDNEGRRPDHPDYDCTTLLIPDSFKSKLTPAMKQWWEMKCNGNMDKILFFKVGKFYETYHMDAVISVEQLGLTYMRGNFAHSGFPEIAFTKMADQLVLKGYKVGRVEQTETVEVMNERTKGKSSKEKVVKREICQVMTSGTRTFSLRSSTCKGFVQEGSDDYTFIEDNSGYLYVVKEQRIDRDATTNKGQLTARIGTVFLNTSTGKIFISEYDDDSQRSRLMTILSRFPASEILFEKGGLTKDTEHLFNTILAAVPKESLIRKKQFLSSEDTLNRLLESDYFIDTPSNKLSSFGLPIGLSEVLNKNDNLGRTAAANYDLAVSALGGLLYYLGQCLLDKYIISLAEIDVYYPSMKIQISNEVSVPFYERQLNMIIDSVSMRNLDLLKNSSTGGIEGTLLERLDFTLTSFGKRLLIQWIAAPLCNPKKIIERQNALQEIIGLDAQMESIKSKMKTLPDLEKLMAKIHALGMTKSIANHPDSRAVLYEGLIYSKRKISDFIATVAGFDTIIKIQSCFSELNNERSLQSSLLKSLMLCSTDCETGTFPDLREVVNFFQNAFNHDDARKTGKIVPERGVDSDFDAAVDSVEDIENQLNDYLSEQKRLLKCNITYFGTARNRYQLEIPEDRCKNLPEIYTASSQRKGFKRYQTEETVRMLSEMMIAEDRRDAAIKNIMSRIFSKFDEHYICLKQAVTSIAELDVLLALSKFSKGLDGGPMARPQIVEQSDGVQPFLIINEGRYPCKGKTQTGEFISNTVKLGEYFCKERSEFLSQCKPVMLLTGPNMGGKSTLMRQTALLIILSQLGCWVPAEGDVILTSVDRLLTRQGANDAIGLGQSTLQVELNETSNILTYMSKNSFLLIDELGRGTATYDGCALACSILNAISSNCCPRTIFSSHFHKLLDEKEVTAKLQICHMACMVEDDLRSIDDSKSKLPNITFLYKLTDGGCPKSYGFNAAKLANITDSIIIRGLEKSKLFEEETLILEFKRLLLTSDQRISLQTLQIWKEKFMKFYSL